MMSDELVFELAVLDLLEQAVYAELESKGVPLHLKLFYRDFAFRLWERAIKFDPYLVPVNTQNTFQIEKASLLFEFEERGLNRTVLDQLQVIAEAKAEEKLLELAVFVGHM